MMNLGFPTERCMYLHLLYSGCASPNMAEWDTSEVTDMSHLFEGYTGDIPNISNWNTEKVTNMQAMFKQTEGRIPDLSKWNTKNVTNMKEMFEESFITDFIAPKWDVRKVEDTSYMFNQCGNLKFINIAEWNMKSLRNMSFMFVLCKKLREIKSYNWKISSSLRMMTSAFQKCCNLVSVDLSKIDTSRVIDMSYLFWGMQKIKRIDVSNFSTECVENFRETFACCKEAEEIIIGENFSTVSAFDMRQMFMRCYFVRELNTNNWNTMNVRDMTGIFEDCIRIKELKVSNWNTSNATTMCGLFKSCRAIKKLDLHLWNTTNVLDMSEMFEDCHSLTNIDLTGWDVRNVTNMSEMFEFCRNLVLIKGLEGFETPHLQEIGYMFRGCSSISHLLMYRFNFHWITDVAYIFAECNSLVEVSLPSGINIGTFFQAFGSRQDCNQLFAKRAVAYNGFYGNMELEGEEF